MSFRPFFQNGQVIGTFRGPGIYQPAVDLAIEKLRTGACCFTQSSVRACSSSSELKPPTRPVTQIHLFSEGAVCRSDTYKADPQTGIAQLQRFKWGVCASSFLFITPQTTEPFPGHEMIPKVYIHKQETPKPKTNTKYGTLLYRRSSWRDGILELESGVSHHTCPWFDDV